MLGSTKELEDELRVLKYKIKELPEGVTKKDLVNARVRIHKRLKELRDAKENGQRVPKVAK